MKPIKTEKQLDKRMKQLEKAFTRDIHNKAVNAINEFVEHNGGITPTQTIEKYADSLCLSGAWAFDRVQDKICTTHSKDYRGSLTKKIRKAIGFTF